MAQVLRIIIDPANGVNMEAEEIQLSKFSPDAIVDFIAETLDNDIPISDLCVNSRHTEFITVTASSIHTDDGDISVMFVGKRSDYRGPITGYMHE